MKKHILVFLVLLLIGVFAQDQQLVGTSDTSAQFTIDDSPGSESRPKAATTAGSGAPDGTNFATFGEPDQQAKATANVGSKSLTSAAQSNAASSNLVSARWIYCGHGKLITIWTPCYHNPCPKGLFTFYFSSTCSFTAYLTDEFGNIISTIGSGSGWVSYAFNFYAPCGKFRIKIVLKCSCFCPYVKYNLYQNRKNCFNCPDNIRQTYNPKTCECECANNCSCRKPQVWAETFCSCICPKSLICPSNKIFNKKTCQCQCLPKCCPKFTFLNSDCICQKGIVFPVDKLPIRANGPADPVDPIDPPQDFYYDPNQP